MSLNRLEDDYHFRIKRREINNDKCDGECRRKIMRKLTEMKGVNDVDSIGCTFSKEETIFDRTSKSKVEEKMEMWKYLSKLSIYLYNDYEFFSQFIIKQNAFDDELFGTSMNELGYCWKDNAWFQEEKPEEDVIINNIFNYCCSLFLINSYEIYSGEESNTITCSLCNSNLENGKCLLCDKKNTFLDHKSSEFTDQMSYTNESIYINLQNENSTKEVVMSSDGNCSNTMTNYRDNNEEHVKNVNKIIYRKPNSTCINMTTEESEKNRMTTNDTNPPKGHKIKGNWKCYCSYLNENRNDSKCSLFENQRRISNGNVEYSIPKDETENQEISQFPNKKILELDDDIKNTDKIENLDCKGCRFFNSLSSKFCTLCMTMDESIDYRRDHDFVEETWLCEGCKTSNHFDRYKCSNCKVFADFSNKWVCEICRFFNDKSANNCVACENENPNIVKCSQCKKKCTENMEKCENCSRKKLISLIQTDKEIKPNQEKLKREEKKESVKLRMKEEDGDKLKRNTTDSVDVMDEKWSLSFISCKSKLPINDNYWCKKCLDSRWFCPNEDCGTINYLNKYCKNCKVEKDSDVSNCRNFVVLRDDKRAQMWMCGFCKKYTVGTINRCSNCKNLRDGMNIKKCLCGWNNSPLWEKCDKCNQIIKKCRKMKK